ncbi:MAG: class I SAM-dependent methyltransferase [Chloroflexaceae bacterium]
MTQHRSSATNTPGFDFGANWQAFSDALISEQRLATAMESLQRLLEHESLEGASMLDVGCGSGLFSLAAYCLGARPVVGIDINPRSIAVSEANRVRLHPDASITFTQMSILDQAALMQLGRFDLVYAWGSLHHTGAMWEAITNTTRLVAPGGTLVMGIYKRHITSPIWRIIKREYNRAPTWIQRSMIPPFATLIYIAKLLVTRRNPLEKQRGMDFWYDVIDWVGGYPYEYATTKEIITFLTPMGFCLRRVIPDAVPTGINEFIFDYVANPVLA